MSRSLLINGDIINPPSSISCVRDLTLVAHEYLNYDVIVECNAEKDFYYRYLKNFGAMDYVDDLIKFGEEEGFRIDTDYNFDPTLYVTTIIDYKNISNILQSIGFKEFNFFKKTL